MIKQKIFQHNYYLGCVIYTDQLRYAIAEKKSKGIKIISYGTLSLPLKKENDSNTTLSTFKKSNTIISIASELAHLKLIPIDASIDTYELKKYIQLNAFNLFKYTYDALYIDHRLILQKLYVSPIRKNQKYLQLLAAKKNDLNDAFSALSLLNVEFSIISIECIAWMNLIKKFLKPVIDIYMIIFFGGDKFSILVVENNHLIYKKQFHFFSDDDFSKSESVIQAVYLIKSLYSSVTFDYYIIMGSESNVVRPDAIKGMFDYFNLASFFKINIPDKILPNYYAVIGLIL